MTPPPKNPRLQFRPKLRELKEQCVSCPFRDGNDKEFGAICSKLVGGGTKKKVTKAQVAKARAQIRDEATRLGDFACHCTVYDADMNLKPHSERRQCPGATKHFIAAGEAMAQKLAPCHFCKKNVDREEHTCHGCNHVVCEECGTNWNMPFGGHEVDVHQDDPEAIL